MSPAPRLTRLRPLPLASAFCLLALFLCAVSFALHYRWTQSYPPRGSAQLNLPLPKIAFSSHCEQDRRSLADLQNEFGEKVGKLFYNSIQTQKRILCDPSADSRRFIIFRPSAGMCNRLQGIVPAFMLAALSRRALLIDWRTTGQFNCDFETIWQPPPFDWTMSQQLSHFHQIWLQNRQTALKKGFDGSYDVLFHSVNQDWLACGNLSNHLGVDASTGEHLTFVKISTDESFTSLVTRGFHRNELRAIFGEQDPFVPVFRFLLRPRAEVQTLVENFKGTRLSQGCDIGLHVRSAMLQGNELKEFWKCAATSDARNSSGPNTVFVSSDNTSVLETAFEGIRAYASNNINVVHFSQNVAEQGKQGCQELREALAEIYLLSSCKTVIGTSWSSFSMMAMSLSSTPWQNKMVANVREDPATGKLVSTGREQFCSIAEPGHCDPSLQRNGCTRHFIKYPCYLEMRHMRHLSCFTPEMFENETCCQLGYCADTCIHHTGWNFFQNLVFYWKVWYPQRYLYQAALVSGLTVFITALSSICSWLTSKSGFSSIRVLIGVFCSLSGLLGLTNAIMFKVVEVYLRG